MKLIQLASVLITFAVIQALFAGVTVTDTLQNGKNSYDGCIDSYLEEHSDATFGTLASIKAKGG